MRLEDYETKQHYLSTVKATTRITPENSPDEVRELTLEVDQIDFSFHAGQSIGLIVPGPHAFGNLYHFRLYTIADSPEKKPKGKPHFTICVKRCNYIDDYSGEEYKGVASNYLCDRKPGDHITLTGPYEMPFAVPDERDANLLLIGMGTGIAPFRALVKHIYKDLGGWKGKVRLFYGARTGLEMLYMNDRQDDFANYYDEETFEAFKALSPRPHWEEPAAIDQALEQNEKEVWDLICDAKTHVYIAGLENILAMLDKAFSTMAGSQEKWRKRKAELIAGGRWVELIY